MWKKPSNVHYVTYIRMPIVIRTKAENLEWQKHQENKTGSVADCTGCSNGPHSSPFPLSIPFAIWVCSSSHTQSRINFLALWLEVWPRGLFWSMEQSNGDSGVQFGDQARRGLVWFCLLPWPVSPPQEEHAQPAGTRRRTGTHGSEPQQGPALTKLLLGEPSPHLPRCGVRNKRSLLNAMDVNAIMHQYCGHCWLVQMSTRFLFQEDFKCKLES